MWMIIATKIRRRVISLGCHTLRRTYFEKCIPPIIEDLKVSSQMMSLEIDKGRSSVRCAMSGSVSQSSITVHIPSQEETKKDKKAKTFLVVNYAHKNPLQRKDILFGRIIDRCIRPLFLQGMVMKINIEVSPLIDRSWESGRDDFHLLAIIATSTALMISDIPWDGPIGAVKIGRVNGNLIVNPTINEQDSSDINFLYACTTEKTIMIDLQGSEISEIDLAIIIRFAHQQAIKCINGQIKISNTYGKEKNHKRFIEISKNISHEVYNDLLDGFRKVFGQNVGKKFQIASALYECKRKWQQEFVKSTSLITSNEFSDEVCDKIKKKALIEVIMLKGHRSNKRKLEEVRPIKCETGFLNGLHGSSLLSRGETQVLCTVCIGLREHVNAQVLLGVHYDFPMFCTNKVNTTLHIVKTRREIGHAMLVHNALGPVFPSDFPYMVYINSTVLSSDGSSSMASVCAGSMALMDAGIPLKTHVAGVSIGVFIDDTGEYRIVTDLLGLEDNLGEMDFKIAGTRNGITAIQLDVKTGISIDIICQALTYGREARLKIIQEMEREIKSPRELGLIYGRSLYWSTPKFYKRRIEVETGARLYAGVDRVLILLEDMVTLQNTVEKVQFINSEAEVGQLYKCTIKILYEKGALVEYHGGRHGLLHIDELSQKVSKVSDVLSIGQHIILKCITKKFNGTVEFSLKEVKFKAA